MGFISDLSGRISDPLDISGRQAGEAAQRAAGTQLESTQIAVEEQRAARLQAREDLSPFREEGAAGLPGLSELVTDPEAQKRFITQNPFFKSLADESQRRLFANQAARGKVGSGGTAEALQNSLLLLGNDLLGKNITQRFNLATLGANAAAGQATATLETGRTISDLTTQGGNARAAGIIGAQNAQTQSRNQAAQLGVGVAKIFASDRRLKKNIIQVGELASGLALYLFEYIWGEWAIGCMADEVKRKFPHAVIQSNGYDMVNYGAIY